ncbi:RICIN domain-containing protein [Saccharothrix syringae]|nr:RICIN domain-containing protein [Saccharothrix syringae]
MHLRGTISAIALFLSAPTASGAASAAPLAESTDATPPTTREVIKWWASQSIFVMDASNFGGHGTPVVLWQDTGGGNQYWVTEGAREGGTYLHPAYSSGLCLDFNGERGYGNPIKVNDCDGSDSQRWFFFYHPSGGNAIATHSDYQYCIDVPDANFSAGRQIQLWGCNNRSSQQWLR